MTPVMVEDDVMCFVASASVPFVTKIPSPHVSVGHPVLSIMVFVVAPYFGLKIFFLGDHNKSGCSNNPTNVMSGVPQGTVLAPLLFLCHEPH